LWSISSDAPLQSCQSHISLHQTTRLIPALATWGMCISQSAAISSKAGHVQRTSPTPHRMPPYRRSKGASVAKSAVHCLGEFLSSIYDSMLMRKAFTPSAPTRTQRSSASHPSNNSKQPSTPRSATASPTSQNTTASPISGSRK